MYIYIYIILYIYYHVYMHIVLGTTLYIYSIYIYICMKFNIYHSHSATIICASSSSKRHHILGWDHPTIPLAPNRRCPMFVLQLDHHVFVCHMLMLHHSTNISLSFRYHSTIILLSLNTTSLWSSMKINLWMILFGSPKIICQVACAILSGDAHFLGTFGHGEADLISGRVLHRWFCRWFEPELQGQLTWVLHGDGWKWRLWDLWSMVYSFINGH